MRLLLEAWNSKKHPKAKHGSHVGGTKDFMLSL